MLDRHFAYCGDTIDLTFIQRIPSNAALVIAYPNHPWSYDYLIDEARIVAVICQSDSIHQFCNSHRMPFRFGWIVINLYAVFARKLIQKPIATIKMSDIEGLIAEMTTPYANPGNHVITSWLGQGEILLACERMQCICFAEDSR